ncbi:uncharacterized protein LOC118563564 [Fundulus heteroclitus]|uniref:uncharacterized protein LOC118563564 n=1 Tax=Fundulus heteroclitus TaxID=8078 RepID=UPI00165B657F|nr:uncharacterized protein LOC118563564 [Fundulus heteroclitus]
MIHYSQQKLKKRVEKIPYNCCNIRVEQEIRKLVDVRTQTAGLCSSRPVLLFFLHRCSWLTGGRRRTPATHPAALEGLQEQRSNSERTPECFRCGYLLELQDPLRDSSVPSTSSRVEPGSKAHSYDLRFPSLFWISVPRCCSDLLAPLNGNPNTCHQHQAESLHTQPSRPCSLAPCERSGSLFPSLPGPSPRSPDRIALSDRSLLGHSTTSETPLDPLILRFRHPNPCTAKRSGPSVETEVPTDQPKLTCSSPPRLCLRATIVSPRATLSLSALVDSGCDFNLIDSSFARRAGLKIFPLDSPLHVSALDGGVLPSITYRTQPFELVISGNHRERLSFFVFPVKHAPLVLGVPWLQQHNPHINWVDHRVESWSSNCHAVCLQSAVPSCQAPPQPPLQADPESLRSVPECYHDLRQVFSKSQACSLPPHRPYDCAIDLLPGAPLPASRLYNISQAERQALEKYIKESLAAGLIQTSSSPLGAGFFFVSKKDGSLRPCIDYRGLNAITVKNRYPLPLLSSALEPVQSATVFSKLDLRNAYHLVRVRRGDEWKTAFKTPLGHFEYRVMPFGLCNAPAVFQALVNDVLRDFLNVFVFVYLDDILIYSRNLSEHQQHVRLVLQRLLENKLFVKVEKCEFHKPSVAFLGLILEGGRVRSDPEKIKAVLEWPVPETRKQLQRFLGFANFYRRFIRGYSQIAAPLHSLTSVKVPYIWNPQADSAFTDLKKRFSQAPVLVHPDPKKQFIVEIDASDTGVGAVLSQNSDPDHRLHPCAFFSRRYQPPLLPEDNSRITVPSVKDHITRCKQYWNQTIQALKNTAETNRRFADRRHVPAPSYHPGQRVWLSTRDLPSRAASKKLSPRFTGPYEIISIVSPTTVRLRLPSHSRVHPTFHVSQIKPVVSSSLCPPAEPPPPAQDHHGRRIQRIVTSRRRGKGFQYLVDWVGRGPEDRTWLAGSSIPDQSLIDSFLSSRPSSSSSESCSWLTGGRRRTPATHPAALEGLQEQRSNSERTPECFRCGYLLELQDPLRDSSVPSTSSRVEPGSKAHSYDLRFPSLFWISVPRCCSDLLAPLNGNPNTCHQHQAESLHTQPSRPCSLAPCERSGSLFPSLPGPSPRSPDRSTVSELSPRSADWFCCLNLSSQ